MQICAIVLYGKNGKKRILSFNSGLNIITGKSRTGKSVIGDIIDYCFGAPYCNIAEGFVREHVAWYGLLLNHNSEYIFIARENPPRGRASTNRCCYLLSQKEIPDDVSGATPIDNVGLEELLSEKLGITENQFYPPPNQSRLPFDVNIRHSLFFCIQSQNEITSQTILFHKQAEDYVVQSIKDSLPYFLGAVNENSVALESELTRLKREATILRREIEEIESVKGKDSHLVHELFAEAQEIGLLSDDLKIDFSDNTIVRATLQKACNYKINTINLPTFDRLSFLQNQYGQLHKEIDDLNIDINGTQEFISQENGYGAEVDHQKNRLESIDLFEQLGHESNNCPFCSKPMENPLPSAKDIRNSITRLSNELNSVAKSRPHLMEYLNELLNKRQQLVEQASSIQTQINAVYEENKAANELRDLNARRGRVIGRISLWLETVSVSDGMDKKRSKLDDIETGIAKINSLLDKDAIEERKQSISSRLSIPMSKWAKELELEHSENPYRIDLNRLTVIVDCEDRSVSLKQLGSGFNWLGCHLITLFALHTFFIDNNRPVPRFLFLDQPSQILFPPETKTNDLNFDTQEIRAIYKFIFERIKELNNNLQVIIVDHADITEPYFQDAVVEKWWDGKKLVPPDWEENKG